MVVTLTDALMVLRPDLTRGTDYRVENDGSGDRIVFWAASAGARPTQAELDAVTPEGVREAADAQVAERRDLLRDAQAAVDANEDFLGLASPGNLAVLNQVRRLTNQNTRIINYLVRQILQGG